MTDSMSCGTAIKHKGYFHFTQDLFKLTQLFMNHKYGLILGRKSGVSLLARNQPSILLTLKYVHAGVSIYLDDAILFLREGGLCYVYNERICRANS